MTGSTQSIAETTLKGLDLIPFVTLESYNGRPWRPGS